MMRLTRCSVAVALVLVLGSSGFLDSAARPALGADPGLAASPAAGAAPRGAFQPYVFWAYGLACFLLLIFSVWTAGEVRSVRAQVRALEERFERAHPGSLDGEGRP